MLARSIAAFRAAGATALHVLGSVGRGTDDAFSDLDLWITVDDAQIGDIVRRRDMLFNNVAPILLSHEALQNRPLGGSYTLVIHETPVGLFQVDYYLAPRAVSVVLPDARLLAGDDHGQPRGSWILDSTATTPTSIEERLDFLACMGFIGVKKILRRDGAFLRFLCAEYHRFGETYQRHLAPLQPEMDLSTITRLLGELAQIADPQRAQALTTLLNRYVVPIQQAQLGRY